MAQKSGNPQTIEKTDNLNNSYVIELSTQCSRQMDSSLFLLCHIDELPIPTDC